MIAKMSGDDIVSSVSRRSRRIGLLRVENDTQSADVEIISPLDELAQRLRASRNGHPFASIGLRCRSDLYGKAADMWLQSKTKGFTYLMAAEQVAHQHNITFADCDRQKIKVAICKRVQAKKQYQNDIGSLIVEVSPVRTTVVADDVGMPKVNKRRGLIRKTSSAEVDALKSNKLQKPYHGAKSHNEYQEMCKFNATTFSCLVRDTNMLVNVAATGMHKAMFDNGVNLSIVSCTRQFAKAINNGCVGVSPQKSGGVALPSSIEKSIGQMVKYLRERRFLFSPRR